MSEIPLYNCYWCICAWCVKAWQCSLRDCYKCRQRDKKGKLPMLKKDCNLYVPENDNTEKLMREIQRCGNCKYKKLYEMLQEKLKGDLD